MAHWLGPSDGQSYLPPDEVIGRLRAEFAAVDVDHEAGAEHVAGSVRQMERLGLPAEHVTEQRRIQSQAVQLVAADAPTFGEAYLRFLVLPGRPILIGYSSRRHERAARPLLVRCARALGYVTELA